MGGGDFDESNWTYTRAFQTLLRWSPFHLRGDFNQNERDRNDPPRNDPQETTYIVHTGPSSAFPCMGGGDFDGQLYRTRVIRNILTTDVK
jgi:hypothetical protein